MNNNDLRSKVIAKMAASHMDAVAADRSYEEPSRDDHTERKCGLDMTYAKSIFGLVKLAQIGFCFLAFIISVVDVGGLVLGIFFSIVVFCGFFFTTVIYFMFITHCDKKVTRIDWYRADLIVSAVGTLLLFAFSMGNVFSIRPIQIVASVFGFLAMVAFAISTWYAFKRWRQNKRVSKSKAEYEVDY